MISKTPFLCIGSEDGAGRRRKEFMPSSSPAIRARSRREVARVLSLRVEARLPRGLLEGGARSHRFGPRRARGSPIFDARVIGSPPPNERRTYEMIKILVAVSVALLTSFFCMRPAAAQTCPGGFPVDCGSYCCQSGSTCGGSCGGQCCSSGGGTCPNASDVDCGSYCCPSGATCGGSCGGQCCTSGGGGGTCPNASDVDCGSYCCPGGATCGGSCGGQCCTGGGGGGGTCPPGYPNDCGNSTCCPSGSTCGGSCGSACCGPPTCPSGYPTACGNGTCCPSGYACGGNCGAACCSTSGGQPSPGGSASGGNSSGSPGGGSGGSNGSGYNTGGGNDSYGPHYTPRDCTAAGSVLGVETSDMSLGFILVFGGVGVIRRRRARRAEARS